MGRELLLVQPGRHQVEQPATPRVAAEVLKVTDVAVAQADRWVMPALFVHSRTDTMCDPEGTERMFGLIASSKQSTLAWTQDLGCPEMWHALISERGCERTRGFCSTSRARPSIFAATR